MSCNTPILRGVFDSTTLQAVAADGLIQFPDVTSNRQCNTINGGTVTLRNPGTYLVIINVTTSATAAGSQEIQLVRNSSVVPGAHAIETAAAVGDFTSMAFAALVTVSKCDATTLGVRAISATDIRIADIIVYEL